MYATGQWQTNLPFVSELLNKERKRRQVEASLGWTGQKGQGEAAD